MNIIDDEGKNVFSVNYSDTGPASPVTVEARSQGFGVVFQEGQDRYYLLASAALVTAARPLVLLVRLIPLIAAVILVVIWKTGPARRARRQARRMQAAPYPAPNANTAPNADAAARNTPDPNGSAAPKPDAQKENKPGPKY